MAGLSLSITISPDDLELIQTLPRQVETLVKTTRQGLDGILAGSDSDNALGALLGGLPNIAHVAEELPALEELIGPLRDLVGELPATSLADIEQIEAAIGEVMQLFGPLVEALAQGGIEPGLQTAITKALEGIGGLLRENDEIAAVTGELQEFFTLFRQMLSWASHPPPPEAVAELLCRALIGIAPDLLAAPAAALETLFAPLGQLLPNGPDLTVWRQAGPQLHSYWQGIDGHVTVGADVDWPALEAELQRGRTSLLALLAARDRLVVTAVVNLGQVRMDGLAHVATALAAVPPVQPVRLSPIFDGLLRTLQGMVEEFDQFTLSPDEVRLSVRELVRETLAAVEQSPMGELRRLLIEFQQRVIRTIEELPLRDLAHQAELALRRVADALQLVDPEVVRQPIRRFFDQITSQLDEIALDTVKDAIQEAWESVNGALAAVGGQLESLRAKIQELVGQLQGLVDSAGPTLEQIGQQVESIKNVLDDFNLDAPTQAVVDELHRLRDKVAAIDVSNLPAAAVGGIKLAAEALRQIDITGAVQGPLDDIFREIDPTPLINRASDTLGSALAPLKQVDPANVIAQLDAPVNELLATLGKFGPEALRRLIGEALQPLKDAIHRIDFAPLLEPLIHLYAELTAKVDAILNPDLIFQPLERLFQPISDLVDALNPTRLVELLEPHAGGLVQNAGNNAGPPAVISSQGDLLRSNLSSPLNSEDPLFGFRPGDLLVPLIDLHHKLLTVFDNLEDSVLTPAAILLRHNTFDRLQAIEPIGIMQQLDGMLAAVQAEFDSGPLFERLSSAVEAYNAVAAKVAVAASPSLSTENQVVAARVTLLLPELDPLLILPDLTQHDALFSATLRIRASVDLGDMRAAYGAVGIELGSLFPAFLGAAEQTGANLRTALRALDPAPVRDQINILFDQVGAKLVALGGVLSAALEEIGLAVEEFLLPLNPSTLVTLASRLHAAAKEQIIALGPATFKDEVKLIFDVVKGQLDILNPAFLVEELGHLRDELLHKLDHLLDDLLPDAGPFNDLQAQLAAFKPSEILAPLADSLEPFSNLVEQLDPAGLLKPLVEAIARIREEVPDAIAIIEAAFDDVLAAFPEGGSDSGSASVSVG